MGLLFRVLCLYHRYRRPGLYQWHAVVSVSPILRLLRKVIGLSFTRIYFDSRLKSANFAALQIHLHLARSCARVGEKLCARGWVLLRLQQMVAALVNPVDALNTMYLRTYYSQPIVINGKINTKSQGVKSIFVFSVVKNAAIKTDDKPISIRKIERTSHVCCVS